MKRLEFISRSLSKIQHKKFELYVISRIIHKLDDPEIKYVFQQYAARDNNTGKYALIDLYLPQLGIAIEVDEAHHKEQYTEDEIRQKEIEQLDIQVERVQCYEKRIEDVNNEIEKIIEKIITKKNELGDNFKPWNGLNGYEYYTNKGYFDINDSTELTSPTEICNCFGFANAAQGGARVIDKETILWWPHENYISEEEQDVNSDEKKPRWYNKLNANGDEIVEKDLNDNSDRFYQDSLSENFRKKRIVFYRKKNMLNEKLYRFVGVFELNVEATCSRKVRVFNRVSDTINLPHQYSEDEVLQKLSELEPVIDKIKYKADKNKANDIYEEIENLKDEYNKRLTDINSNKELCADDIERQKFLLGISRTEKHNKIYHQINALLSKID